MCLFLQEHNWKTVLLGAVPQKQDLPSSNFSGNAMLTSSTVNQMNRVSQDTTSKTTLLQNGNTDLTRRSYQTGIGFDWDMNDKNNLSGSVGAGYTE